MENKDKGYVSIYRSIREHHLYPNRRAFTEFEAWIDMLLSANHKPGKAIFERKIVNVERGQFVTSELGLSLRWLWGRTALRSFLKLLEADGMILKKTTTKYTMITICNYDSYQRQQTTNKQQPNNGQTTGEQHPNTNNNDNNENNDNNDNKESIDRIYSAYPTTCPYRQASTGKSSKDKDKIKKLLEKYSEADLLKIITCYLADCEPKQTYLKNFSTFLNNLPIDFLTAKVPVTMMTQEEKTKSLKAAYGEV